jgi:membrane-bound lytic murein transglycosylase B
MGHLEPELKTGFDSHYSPSALRDYGIRPARGEVFGETSLLALSTTNGDQYLLGFPNFYVITRYNHSTYYALAVYQLGQAIKQRYSGFD